MWCEPFGSRDYLENSGDKYLMVSSLASVSESRKYILIGELVAQSDVEPLVIAGLPWSGGRYV